MGQSWEDLLFAHWRVPADALREHVPERLEVDVRDGSAWIGITPFRVNGLRLRGTLPVPYVSTFLEINVRTYVTYDDKPGIWFFSLDAASQFAVEAARRSYKLPYFRARMSARGRADWIAYESARMQRTGGEPFVFSGEYRAVGPVFEADPDSLEAFLAERYCLYTVDERRRLCRAEIHHPPWPLQTAEARIELNTMTPPGLELPPDEPLLHFAARQDVVIWPLAAIV